jgi:hypothetical protein
MPGNCPGSCPGDSGANCCLYNTDAGVWGTCATPAACAQMGGGFVQCGNTPDTTDCTPEAGTTCCLALSDAGGLPGSYCAMSCPSGTPYACNTDQSTCPNNGAGWMCSPINSTVPFQALGECTPYDGGAVDGGSDGATDGGSDAAADGGTDAPVDDTGVTDAGGQ